MSSSLRFHQGCGLGCRLVLPIESDAACVICKVIFVTFEEVSDLGSNSRYSAVKRVNLDQSSSSARRFHFQTGRCIARYGNSNVNTMGLWSEMPDFGSTFHLVTESAALMFAMVKSMTDCPWWATGR